MANLEGLQIRADRALLRWRIEDLAIYSGVDVATIRKAEQINSETMVIPDVAAVRRALEAAGVEFTNGPEPVVRLAAHAVSGNNKHPHALKAISYSN